MLLRDLGPSVVVAAVFCFIKFEFVRVVIFVCLSAYSGGVWEGNLNLPGAAIYRHWCLSYFLFPLLVRLPPVSAVTPLQAEQFAWELRLHPNRQKVNFVLEGLRHGFHLGFSPSQKLKSAKKNKPSAAQHPSVVDQYLANEVSLGRVAGPFSAPPYPNLHVSSFGVIPKRGQPGKWRLIVDLSSPGGASVNDGIDPDEFTLHYITVDQVIRVVSKLGWGALMAKFDVKA